MFALVPAAILYTHALNFLLTLVFLGSLTSAMDYVLLIHTLLLTGK